MTTPAPTPSDQIRFLQQLQRLLDEGSFTATYKYALLHAIADLCVQHGADTGDALSLDIGDIAERFVELYWRQVAPFPAIADDGVLVQSTWRHGAIIDRVREARARYGGSLRSLQQQDVLWGQVRRGVRAIVRKYPLRHLQTVGGTQVAFLYDFEAIGRSSTVTLKPGVMYSFRAFYPLVTDLIEGAWAQYVRKLNPELLGTPADLHSFLFGMDRASLARYREAVEGFQDGRCFYCEAQLGKDVAVDHFVPWSRYPVDLGHNFVLTDPGCNSRKGDLLAAEEHLERWAARNRTYGEQLGERFTELGVPHHLKVSYRVTRWAYGNVRRADGQVWVHGRELRVLEDGWERVLEVSP